jgi:hypothetical protein
VGDWIGEGSGQPGQGSGQFSFRFDLEGKILVRRNRSDYPATKDHPAFSHEDLMVIYADTNEEPTRAIYFDSEGHVIRYTATFSDDQKGVTLLSDLQPGAPRFRLTYRADAKGAVRIQFEVAPPDKPEAFSTYVEGVAHREHHDP